MNPQRKMKWQLKKSYIIYFEDETGAKTETDRHSAE
jgi:hypothetical protein